MTEVINRAFLYGESVFTTMRMISGHVRDWEFHFDRLKRGVEILYGPFSDGDWVRLLRLEMESRLNHEAGEKILRLTVFVDQTHGLNRNRLISVKDLRYHLHANPLDINRMGNKFLKLRTSPGPSRPEWWPSFLKAGNYLETILAQKKYLKDGDDDLIFISSKGTVTESSVANIFMVRHNKLYTPPLGPNVLEGIMRQKVLDVAGKYFEAVLEKESTLKQLLKADAVFGSNSIRGPFLVDRVNDRKIDYTQDFILLFENLRNEIF